MSFRPVRALVRKDLLVHLTDRRAVIMSFLLPAALASFMALAFHSSGDGMKALHVPIIVVDEEKSVASQRLVGALQADPTLTATPLSRAEAEAQIQSGEGHLAVVVPAGFTTKVVKVLGAQVRSPDPRAGGEAERPPALVFLADPSDPMTAGIATGILRARVVETLADAATKAKLAECAAVSAPYTVETRTATIERYSGAGHSVGGMAVQFILMASVESAVLLLMERQRGLWRRVRTAPIGRSTVLGARILSSALIALMTLGFLIAFGKLLLGVEINGSLLGLGLVAVSFALMAATLGVLVSTLGKTPQATRGAGIFVILVMVMLGGAWVPTFLLPEWLQAVTRFIPTRWAVDGLDAVLWRGLGLEAVLVPTALMLGAAVVMGALATWRFRWEE